MTGALITVGRAEDCNMIEEDGPWVTICDTHGSICGHATKQLADSHSRAPQWCMDCQEIMDKKGYFK